MSAINAWNFSSKEPRKAVPETSVARSIEITITGVDQGVNILAEDAHGQHKRLLTV